MYKKFLQTSTLILSLANMPVANAVILENDSKYDTVTVKVMSYVNAPAGHQQRSFITGPISAKQGESIKVSSDEIIEAWKHAQKDFKEPVTVKLSFSARTSSPQYHNSWLAITLSSQADFDKIISDSSKLIFTGLGEDGQVQFEYKPE